MEIQHFNPRSAKSNHLEQIECEGWQEDGGNVMDSIEIYKLVARPHEYQLALHKKDDADVL